MLVEVIKDAINWSDYSIENFSDLISFDVLSIDQLNELQDFFDNVDRTKLERSGNKLKLFKKFTERIRITLNHKLKQI